MTFSMRRALVRFGSVPLLGVALIACGRGGRPGGPPPTAAKDTVFAVQVLELQPGDITNYIRINGEVRSANYVDVFPEVAGRVTRVSSGLGRDVQKDQVLLYVDPSRPGAEFVESPVRAPISGVIVSFPFSVGATVGPQTPVARVARAGDLELVTNVAERFSALVRPGQRASVVFEAFPGKRFEAFVASVAPQLDPVSRTLEVRLRLENLDPAIRAGMYADIRIVTEVRRRVLRVPSDAVVNRFGETFVFVAHEDGTAERRVVVKGLEIDNVTELVSGVSAGEKVVIRGQTLLEDGSKIRIVDQGSRP